MPRRTFTTAPLDETPTGHCTELLYDDGASDDLLVCAAHGGGVEPGTAEGAIELATRLPEATCWARLGYDREDAFGAYHPPSTAIDPADHPLLASIADRGFATVVSLHGLADEAVLVGGGTDEATKRAVADRLDRALPADVDTVSQGEYAGVSPENFVNWLGEGGGLQVEMGPTVRAERGDAVVSALAALRAEGRL